MHLHALLDMLITLSAATSVSMVLHDGSEVRVVDLQPNDSTGWVPVAQIWTVDCTFASVSVTVHSSPVAACLGRRVLVMFLQLHNLTLWFRSRLKDFLLRIVLSFLWSECVNYSPPPFATHDPRKAATRFIELHLYGPKSP